MSGKLFLVDTNCIIELLSGNDKLVSLLENADWIGISIISVLEFYSFTGITKKDISAFKKFISKIEVVDLKNSDKDNIKKIIKIRTERKIKLPDAIIYSTAVMKKAILLTADKQLLSIDKKIVKNWKKL